MRGSVLRCFVPVQLTLRETFRPYLQSGRSAQNPCLIISYLYRCSVIRVWMLARHLGKDLGYNSSPDSQGEKACGLLYGRATGYKDHLWL